MMRTILLAVVAALAAGCGRRWPPADEVVVLIEALPGDLDPRLALTGYGAKVARLIAAPLVSCDNDRLEPRPDLAEEIVQESPTEYRVRLRDARFSDGRPVTARDVAFTFTSVRSGPMGAGYKSIASIEAVDPRTVRFHLHEPHAPFVTDLDLGVVPEGLPMGPDPVGAGPFRLAARDETHLLLERNPYYFGGKVRPRRVTLRVIRDDNARLLALAGGSADLTQNTVPAVLLDAVAENPRLRIQSGPSSNLSYLGLNLSDPRLSDVRVRRAIAYAIDRERILRVKLRGRGRLATGMLAPLHWAYEPDVERYPFDPERARKLLDEAGLRDPDGPGPEPRLHLSYETSSKPDRLVLARVIARQLLDVGIAVEVRSFELGTLFDDIKRGNFQMFSLQVTEVAEPDYLYAWFHSSRIPTPADLDRGQNRFRYRSAALDRLVEAGRRESDRARRKVLYAEAQRVLARDLPMIPLYHEDNVVVSRREVHGYRPVPDARFATLWQVWKDGAR
jgi:peptide/nickel transport system substrate-binding protein